MMLLKFDSAFASSATAGKGFNLTVKSAYQGKKQDPMNYLHTEDKMEEL